MFVVYVEKENNNNNNNNNNNTKTRNKKIEVSTLENSRKSPLYCKGCAKTTARIRSVSSTTLLYLT